MGRTITIEERIEAIKRARRAAQAKRNWHLAKVYKTKLLWAYQRAHALRKLAHLEPKPRTPKD